MNGTIICSGILIEHCDGTLECSLGTCRGHCVDSQHDAGISCGWATDLLPDNQEETPKHGATHRCVRCDHQTKEAA